MTGVNCETALNLSGEERELMVHDLLNAEFMTTKEQDEDKEDSRDETDLAFFCVNCRGNTLTKLEVELFHEDHYLLRAMKCSGSYGYVIKEVSPLFEDLSGVYEYKINGHYLYFPKSRKKHNHNQINYNRIHGNCCAKCKHILVRSGFLFCSIDCKLTCPDDVLQQHLEWMKLKQNRVRLPVAKKRRIVTNDKEMITNECNKNKLKRNRVRLPAVVKKRKIIAIDREIITNECNKNKLKRNRVRLPVVVKKRKISDKEMSKKKKKQKVSIDVDLKGLVTVAMKEAANGKMLSNECSHSYRKRSRKGVPHRAPLY